VDALPHEHSNLEVDTLTDSKPVELSQDRSDVFSTGRAAFIINTKICKETAYSLTSKTYSNHEFVTIVGLFAA